MSKWDNILDVLSGNQSIKTENEVAVSTKSVFIVFIFALLLIVSFVLVKKIA